jgi:uncharacterized protein YaaR (DUF327 family)
VGDVWEPGPLRETAPSEEALQELLDSVHGAGDDLKRRPFPDAILNYKQAVRNFLHYVVQNSYDLQEVQGIKKKTSFQGSAADTPGGTVWKSKVYHQIQIIDQKLEILAADILAKQIAELDLKSRIDEIRGLLVDLTVTGKIKERDE